MLHQLCTLRVWTIVWLVVLVAIPALLPGTAAAQDPASAPGLTPRLLADASWHGRPIQRPLPLRSDVSDRAPSLRPGTGFRRAGGSRRVRDLQRRLIRLGYRPGTRDGLFGPRTQAAVLAFQHKHGLERTGSVGQATLRVLRRRTAPGAPAGDPAAAPPVRTQSEPARVAPASGADAGTGGGTPAMILLLAGAVPLLVLAGLLARRRTAPVAAAEQRALPAPEPAAPVFADPAPVADAAPPVVEAPRIRRPPPHHGPSHERRVWLRERILAMRAQGMSLQEIADQLTAEGEITLGGGRTWQPWSVRAATRPVSPAGRARVHARRESP